MTGQVTVDPLAPAVMPWAVESVNLSRCLGAYEVQREPRKCIGAYEVARGPIKLLGANQLSPWCCSESLIDKKAIIFTYQMCLQSNGGQQTGGQWEEVGPAFQEVQQRYLQQPVDGLGL